MTQASEVWMTRKGLQQARTLPDNIRYRVLKSDQGIWPSHLPQRERWGGAACDIAGHLQGACVEACQALTCILFTSHAANPKTSGRWSGLNRGVRTPPVQVTALVSAAGGAAAGAGEAALMATCRANNAVTFTQFPSIHAPYHGHHPCPSCTLLINSVRYI
jgi:hypothetical protein